MNDEVPIDSPVVAYIAASLEQAHIVRNALEERGIAAQITNVALQFGVGELPLGTPTAARVLVAQQDLDAARQIVQRFDSGEGESDDDHDGGEPWDEEADDEKAESGWPRCPSCGRGRHTSCPTCGTAGTKFPRAYLPPGQSALNASEEGGVAVVCGICDEPFTAEFPSRCEWCGYRFADGRDAAPPPTFVDEMNPRVWIVLIGLLGVVAAVLAWGWYIAPRD